MLVGRIVVHDEMDVAFGRRLAVNGSQDSETFPMAMTLGPFADPLAGRHIEGGEQGRGSVSNIVMGLGRVDE